MAKVFGSPYIAAARRGIPSGGNGDVAMVSAHGETGGDDDG